jgi:hypothetical protein
MSLEAAISEAVHSAITEALRAHVTPIVVTIEPRQYSGAEACKLLKMDNAKVYGLLKTGALRGTRDQGAKAWKVSSFALAEFILAREGRAAITRIEALAIAAD